MWTGSSRRARTPGQINAASCKLIAPPHALTIARQYTGQKLRCLALGSHARQVKGKAQDGR
jgi:hypothetical protein